ncbi:MAG: hypothetical protein RMK65_07375 [Anaerolineae bacterium]|nr:hypothetical protein [Anaerolineae bacterium]MCX8067141.1 hypothetical protein [Anaerolineae bacterium]MDW7991936.1 hypothetical protein [Anaerolineae bacterium]
MLPWWTCFRRWFSRRKPVTEASPPNPEPDSLNETPTSPPEDVFQRSVERLLEDESLTADLVDDAAERLLAWGRDRVWAILNEEVGATEDHPRLVALRRQMRAIARQVGELPPDQQAEALQRLLAEQ